MTNRAYSYHEGLKAFKAKLVQAQEDNKPLPGTSRRMENYTQAISTANREIRRIEEVISSLSCRTCKHADGAVCYVEKFKPVEVSDKYSCNKHEE